MEGQSQEQHRPGGAGKGSRHRLPVPKADGDVGAVAGPGLSDVPGGNSRTGARRGRDRAGASARSQHHGRCESQQPEAGSCCTRHPAAPLRSRLSRLGHRPCSGSAGLSPRIPLGDMIRRPTRPNAGRSGAVTPMPAGGVWSLGRSRDGAHGDLPLPPGQRIAGVLVPTDRPVDARRRYAGTQNLRGRIGVPAANKRCACRGQGRVSGLEDGTSPRRGWAGLM